MLLFIITLKHWQQSAKVRETFSSCLSQRESAVTRRAKSKNVYLHNDSQQSEIHLPILCAETLLCSTVCWKKYSVLVLDMKSIWLSCETELIKTGFPLL